jgi:uncharacterized membrane protein YkgB
LPASEAKEVAAKQMRVDLLLKRLPFVSLEADWMHWIREFAKAADDVGVTFNRHELAEYLTSNGWVADARVSDDPEDRAFLQVNRTAMAEYIMGQVIVCLNMGMCPHPITITFVEKYLAIKS